MKPRIIVLDGYTMNPGDLSWAEIESLGKLTVYDRTTPEQVLERSLGAAILLTNKTVIDSALIDSLPDLRFIGVLATGYNVVDLKAARERGIPVANVPEYSTASVAEMVFALILELARRVGHHEETVRNGRWSASADFCYWNTPQIELNGLTMGIVGFGRIGRAVGRIAQAFGMRVLAHEVNPAVSSEQGVSFVPLDDLFRKSDIVSLNCILNDETRGMVNTSRLALMKSSAWLINAGRGPLVVDRDLADALNEGVIAGAGLDVLTVEPPREGNPLIGAKNCIITPHIAWATLASRKRLMSAVAENIRAFLAGQPANVVNTQI